jgi:hypothetical protein
VPEISMAATISSDPRLRLLSMRGASSRDDDNYPKVQLPSPWRI